jgi:hypothetical protein
VPIIKQVRQAIRKIVFGDTLLPHAVTLELKAPQAETTVWLDGSTNQSM